MIVPMILTQVQLGTVESARYSQIPHPQSPQQMIDGFVVVVQWRGETHEVAVPNAGFVLENLAFQFMAYCGVRPSTLDEIAGAEVPMVDHPEAGVTVTDAVFNGGKAILQKQEWAPLQ